MCLHMKAFHITNIWYGSEDETRDVNMISRNLHLADVHMLFLQPIKIKLYVFVFVCWFCALLGCWCGFS